MRLTKNFWRKAMLWAPLGGMLLQAPTCNEPLLGLTTLSSAITAGGVIYLIARVLE
jgi:hypothetical protein